MPHHASPTEWVVFLIVLSATIVSYMARWYVVRRYERVMEFFDVREQRYVRGLVRIEENRMLKQALKLLGATLALYLRPPPPHGWEYPPQTFVLLFTITLVSVLTALDSVLEIRLRNQDEPNGEHK
jgi:phosphatidylglycerophosphate synthase